MSKVIEALPSVIKIIAHSPQLIFIVLDLLAILIGWAFGLGWIIAIGFYILIMGIVSKKSRGEFGGLPPH